MTDGETCRQWTICCVICKHFLAIAPTWVDRQIFLTTGSYSNMQIYIGNSQYWKKQRLKRSLVRPLMTPTGEIPAFDTLFTLISHIQQTNRLSKPESAPVDQRPIRAALDHLVPKGHPIFPSSSTTELFRLLIEGAESRLLPKLSSDERATMYRCRIQRRSDENSHLLQNSQSGSHAMSKDLHSPIYLAYFQ